MIILNNLEKYNEAFKNTLNLTDDRLTNLEYQSIKEWDSIGHMSLMSELEDLFNIELETDDIIDFSSYEKGKEILKKYGIEI